MVTGQAKWSAGKRGTASAKTRIFNYIAPLEWYLLRLTNHFTISSSHWISDHAALLASLTSSPFFPHRTFNSSPSHPPRSTNGKWRSKATLNSIPVSDEAARAAHVTWLCTYHAAARLSSGLTPLGVVVSSREVFDFSGVVGFVENLRPGLRPLRIKTHWHKRVVRSGPSTLCPFEENPPDRVIEEDDILIVDLGPVFEAWEADFGRTFVLGSDAGRLKVRDALESMWHKVKGEYDLNPDMSGEELYSFAVRAAEVEALRVGCLNFGPPIAGHIVGLFPHERVPTKIRFPRDKIALYITKGNDKTMNCVGGDGLNRHWILEIHLWNPQPAGPVCGVL
ncbi:hypothetical protein E4U36_004729 [Claviceps purpurea]|nr:hypothetical protein E4U36_004729 [Claviceps purpurea]KAG6269668.1 hypothetical protein E4U49_006254 [Claviceps purpurea]